MTSPLVTELEAVAKAALASVPGWGGPLLSFVLSELPQVLGELEQGQELQALLKLAALYEARRTEAMADRRPEIAQNEAEVDALLAQRAAAEAKPTT